MAPAASPIPRQNWLETWPETDADADPASDPRHADDGEVSPGSILEAMLFVGDRGGGLVGPAARGRIDAGRGGRRNPRPGRRAQRPIPPPRLPLRDNARRGGLPHDASARVPRGPRSILRRVREARLSQAALDVLAIVAYQQPVTAEVVGTLRGTPSRRDLDATRPPPPAAHRMQPWRGTASSPASGAPHCSPPPIAS